MPSFLDLPAPVIEQIAKVRLDEDIYYLLGGFWPKRFCFWALREVGHRGVHTAAWGARHSVVKAELKNVAWIGDTEWCAAMLARREYSEAEMAEALDRAARSGQVRVGALLLRHGAPVEGDLRPLLIAADCGNTAFVALLLDSGARINSGRFSPLMGALENGHLETAEFLLERGADIHADDEAALRRVAVGDDPEAVLRMIARGADPRANEDGALVAAALGQQNLEVVQILLDAGCDPRSRGGEAIREAVKFGSDAMVRVLVTQWIRLSDQEQVPLDDLFRQDE